MKVRIARALSRAWGLIASSLATTIVQIVAIFIFDPRDFGTLALMYLGLSLGNAAAYSIVCEPWSADAPTTDVWDQYATILALVAVASGVPVLLIGISVGESVTGVVVSIAVAAGVYRIGSRYYSVVVGHDKFVSRPDTATLIALAILLGIAGVYGFSLLSVSLAWATAALIGVILSERPKRIAQAREICSWFAARWAKIKYLLIDSALTEAGTAGVPLAMAPIMGVSDFGIYRSASSMTSPVRMVLNPLRPTLSRMSLRQAVGLRSASFGLGLAAATGLAIFLGLEAIGILGLFAGSTISELSKMPFAVAAFVGTYAITVYSYFSLRTQVGGRALVVYRIVQLVLFAALPVSGYFLAGVPGAVWARATSSVLTVALSWCIMRKVLSNRKPHET